MAVTTTTLTVKDGNNVSQALAAGADPAGVLRYIVTTDAMGVSQYRAAILYSLGVATPTAIVVMQGSATKTCRITRIAVQGWSTTAGVMKWKVTRRSTAGTLGSAVLTPIPNQGKNDSGTVASPTLTISTVGTANYTTLGTNAGILDVGLVGFNLASQINTNIPYLPIGSNGMNQALVLRGVADWITIDGGADAGGDAVPAGAIAAISVEWIEDAS